MGTTGQPIHKYPTTVYISLGTLFLLCNASSPCCFIKLFKLITLKITVQTKAYFLGLVDHPKQKDKKKSMMIHLIVKQKYKSHTVLGCDDDDNIVKKVKLESKERRSRG
jgi:hypothetical protein